jgi:hypothetical protein
MKTFILALIMTSVLSATQVTMNFITTPTQTASGYYVGYASATVNDIYTNIMCDDFTHTTYFPSGPMTYNLSTYQDLTSARFTRSQYEVAAILLSEFDTIAPVKAGEYNFALWKLFDSNAPDFGNSNKLLSDAIALQKVGSNSVVYNQLIIYTPTSQFYSNQEFLSISSTQGNVPEPATFALAGLSLMLIAAWRIKQR